MIHPLTSDRTKRAFYQMLGEVFYTVASADKKIRKEEIEAMMYIIKSEWIKYDHSYDRYGTDYVCQIDMAFNWLAENGWDTKDAIDHLKSFRKGHTELFTEAAKILILKTADAIASAFAGKNKIELIILSQIESALS